MKMKMKMKIGKIFRRIIKEESLGDLMEDITTSTEFEFESKLRKLGFRKIIEKCNKLGFMNQGGSERKKKLGRLITELSHNDAMRFTNDRKPYTYEYVKRPPIYFYIGDFFVSLTKNRFKYNVYYIKDDGYISDISNIIDMEVEEISRFLGNLGDSNAKIFDRNNKIEKILNDE